LSAAGEPQPAWARAESTADVTAFAAEHGWPVVLKTPRGGYDGRGVFMVDDAAQAAEVLAAHGSLLVEQRVTMLRELAAQVARSPYGQVAVWPVVETVQRNGVCHEVLVPAPGLDDATATAAQELAVRIADQLG